MLSAVLAWCWRPPSPPATFDSYGDITVLVDDTSIDTYVSAMVMNAAPRREHPDSCAATAPDSDSALGLYVEMSVDSAATAPATSFPFRWMVVLAGSMRVPQPVQFAAQLQRTESGLTSPVKYAEIGSPSEPDVIAHSSYGYRNTPVDQLGRQIFYGDMTITRGRTGMIDSASPVCGPVSQSSAIASSLALPSLGLSFDAQDNFKQLVAAAPDLAADLQPGDDSGWYRRLTADSRLDLEPRPRGPFEVRYAVVPPSTVNASTAEWVVRQFDEDDGTSVQGLDATNLRLVWLDAEQAATDKTFYSGVAGGVAGGGVIGLLQISVDRDETERTRRSPGTRRVKLLVLTTGRRIAAVMRCWRAWRLGRSK